ncbi:DUF3817 domain-containing protein [Terribacillus saccharophilus]|uniref:Membrane protein n=1 Tax=Terribacillus saccharophilus TaxID=361277 RepID=A0A075LLZ3_9BACI|nr:MULTISPECIES: DUF3817 domain-containing protein [Terribacillus]AIF65458.1 membrane protein [Terribacillus goriensis]MCM3227117.1 DUF3817 domain-containing protein [Terribacillus saccharophilus]MEC0284122.1 DUF3817 domain-containing protein [Terribacillus saccharophilus]MEC0289668.1 DUF3817 domain-containing protein [Terribacillus saccharophilus]MEC0301478.1 DUF3817 domain-containing protein [Terribacillus saccharophilus]
MQATLKWFRIIGFLEGTSLLLLLFMAMPLKYMMDIPIFVTYIGAIHGGLFVLYVIWTGYTTLKVGWGMKWAILALIASVIPFGYYILDMRLQKTEYA